MKTDVYNRFNFHYKHNIFRIYTDFRHLGTTINIVEPLLGVLMLIQTIQNWNKNKTSVILSLIATILIFSFSNFTLII